MSAATRATQRALFPLLYPLSHAYAALTNARNAYFDRTPGAVSYAPVPVVSVGNLTTGGTGKTPLVIEIVRILRDRGERPAILTRGYAAKRGRESDEVLEFRDALPNVPVVVDRDRARAARRAAHRFHATCCVLDDGFQHRSLGRALDLVALDALDPWGGNALLPAGNLRERLAGAARAHVFVITRANQVEEQTLQAIAARLARWNSNAPVLSAAVAPDQLRELAGAPLADRQLQNDSALAVCGIGNPVTFQRTVGELVGRCEAVMRFADHHAYTTRDVARIAARARDVGASVVVTTRKDWVKLAPLWNMPDTPQLVRVDVRLKLTTGYHVLCQLLDRKLTEVRHGATEPATT